MLNGEERRAELIKILENSIKPISGTELAKRFRVSRQVIVQDIALLRAVNKNILAIIIAVISLLCGATVFGESKGDLSPLVPEVNSSTETPP